LVPDYEDLNWKGAAFDADRFASVMQVERAQWERELASHDELFGKLGAKLPAALQSERERLAQRLAQ
jgi:phosphoenolpyruvate carboxykinase (GTP)